ncbi:ESX secretion-associated protein EspG [Amycolatopsis pigmentata]|uniref:ESX secretion-associated protein EspG n=1 Tax=Amycolatopsis pigmentata TaxID=450801 RepID=A0ABW5FM72_9PSEU
MTVIDRPLRLPRLAFLTAWELQGLGTPHPIVGVNDLYLTDEFRADILRRTLARLTDLDLATPNGLKPALQHTLTTIASATRELYAWSSFRNGDTGAILLASRGDHAVRLITDGTAIHLDPIDPNQLTQHFVETLPDVPGARVRPITITNTDYNGDRDRGDPLAEPNVAEQQAAYLRELMRTERDAVHQMYAAVRDSQDVRHRSVPISAIDLSHRGRVVTFLSDGDGGPDAINLVSGTPTKLISVLKATLSGL